MEKISSIIREIAGIDEVESVILYGSHARGEAGKKSDIDILVLVSGKVQKVQKLVMNVINKHPGSKMVPVVETSKSMGSDPVYFYEILRDGLVLYKKVGSPVKLPFGARKERAKAIYQITLSNLRQRDKSRVNRALYGVKGIRGKNKKVYLYAGLLERVGGEMLGRGVVMVPSRAEGEVDDLLGSYSIKFRKLYVVEVARE